MRFATIFLIFSVHFVTSSCSLCSRTSNGVEWHEGQGGPLSSRRMNGNCNNIFWYFSAFFVPSSCSSCSWSSNGVEWHEGPLSSRFVFLPLKRQRLAIFSWPV